MAAANPAAPGQVEEGRIMSWMKENWMQLLFCIIFALTLTWLVIAVLSHPSKAEVAEMIRASEVKMTAATTAAIDQKHAATIVEVKENILKPAMSAEREYMVSNYGLKQGGQQAAAPVTVSCQSACPVPAAAPKRVASAPVAAAPAAAPQVQPSQPQAQLASVSYWAWYVPGASAADPKPCYTTRAINGKPALCSGVEVFAANAGESEPQWVQRVKVAKGYAAATIDHHLGKGVVK